MNSPKRLPEMNLLRISTSILLIFATVGSAYACPTQSIKHQVNAQHNRHGPISEGESDSRHSFHGFHDKLTILSPKLKHGLTHEKLPLLPGSAGTAPISNCAALIDAIRSGADISEQTERREFGAYSMCLAREIVKKAAPASASRFDLHKAGQQIVDHLDLDSIRSSLAQRRPWPHAHLSDFEFKSARIEPHSVTLTTDYFRYVFDVLAAGDFQGSGQRELLVQYADQAIIGNYNSRTILILSWPPGQDSIQAKEAIDFMRNAGPLSTGYGKE